MTKRFFILSLLLLILLISGCGSGQKMVPPQSPPGDQTEPSGDRQGEHDPTTGTKTPFAPPPSRSADILTKEKDQIRDWLREVDVWRFQAIPKKFQKEDEPAVRSHLEKVYPKAMVDEYLQTYFTYDEKSGAYTMLDTDFHPDIAAWKDPYSLDIRKDEKSHSVSLILSGETVYDPGRESKIGFDFLQEGSTLKILRFKYTIVDELTIETPQNQDQPVLVLPLPGEWKAIPKIIVNGETSFTNYTIIHQKGDQIGEFAQIGRNADSPDGYLPNHLVREKNKAIETKLGPGRLYELEVDLPKEERTDQHQTYEMVYLLIPIKNQSLSYLFSIDVPLGESIEPYVKKVEEIFQR